MTILWKIPRSSEGGRVGYAVPSLGSGSTSLVPSNASSSALMEIQLVPPFFGLIDVILVLNNVTEKQLSYRFEN